MNLRHIGLVYTKELLDTIRDRRTLIVMIVVPLLIMPLLIFGPNMLRLSQEESKVREVQKIAVVNSGDAPQLIDVINQSQQLQIIETEEREVALLDGKISAILIVPVDFEQKISSEGSKLSVVIQFDLSNTSSKAAVDKLELILGAYRINIIEHRLEERGIAKELIEPFSFSATSIAPEERVSGFFLSMLLPLFLVLYAAVGGAQTAIDVTAGEKERGTLESLLVSPPHRASLVLGKFLTILTVTVAATTLSLAGFALSLTYGKNLFPESQLFDVFNLAISFDSLALLFATTGLVSAMMSALTFALYLWTRNFKEAQTYTTYLSFTIMIPAFAVSFMDPPTTLQSYFVPIYGAAAVIKELLLGTVNWSHLLATWSSAALYALIGLVIGVRLFNNEKVLFRQ